MKDREKRYSEENIARINSQTWDIWAKENNPWTIPVSHEEFERAKAGQYRIYLTPRISVSERWLGELKGKKVLGLASGGGQQMPVLTALGAHCTVMDYSEEQLAREKSIAQREGYEIEIVHGDMTQRFPFEDQTFDLIFHPVSNCYIKDVGHVWNECARVLKKGGILLAGFDNGVNFLFDSDREPLIVTNSLPYNPLEFSMEKQRALIETGEGFQFSHTLEEQIGGQLKAGFRLLDLYEDRDREGDGDIWKYMPQYIATRAIKEG